jgi:DNA-binding transcriptional LysR family regulator
VSQTIKRLEGGVGEQLLDRSSKEVVLTAAGEALREYAQKMLNLREEAGQAISQLRQLHRGVLNLAANEHTCLCLLPLLDHFRRANPLIKVAVHRSLASRVADEVLMHAVEMGVVSFRPPGTEVSSIVIYRDQLAFVVNPEHPLAQREQVSIEDLGGESFVAHNVPSPQRERVIQAFERQGTPLRMGVELPSLEAIKRFVGMGNGVALVPRLTVEPELASGRLVQVRAPELQFERKLRLVYRRQAALSHAAEEFLRGVEMYARQYGDPYGYEPERAV